MPRILVADDNSNIHRTVALALKEAGVEVIAVGNGEAAVRKIAEVKPDLVLADIFMPVRSGYEVCEFVKQDPRFSHVPVVLLIGAFDPFDEREAQRVQADAILKKPFVPPDSLLRTVADLLAKSASRTAPAPVAATVAQTDRPSTPAPASQTQPVESINEEPEDFPPAMARFEWDSKEQPLAFGTLLETPAAADTDDSVMTSRRDPNLGEPMFWAPKAQPQDQQDESGEEGAPAGSSTTLAEEETWPSGAEINESPAQTEPTAQEARPESLIELPESVPELPELPSPVNLSAETPAEPLQDSALELPEIPSFELERPEKLVPRPTLDSFSEPPALKVSRPQQTPEEVQDSLPDLKDFSWAAPTYQEDQPPSQQALASEDDAKSEADLIEEVTPGLATLAPFLASLTSAASARGAASKEPFDFDPVPALPGELQSDSAELESAEAVDAPAASPLDPAVIEAIAQRVIERMQPKLIELVTRELLRPAVEALVQRELEKK